MNNKLIRNCFTIEIIIILIGACIISSTTSEQTIIKRLANNNIITVDDEPGDADFTSIGEAVNASGSDVIIEVYSGTYYEQGIRVTDENITLLGISQELGGGDDSGKPVIKGDGYFGIIWLSENKVVLSNFIIEDISQAYQSTCIWVRTLPPQMILQDVLISNCTVCGSIGATWTTGINVLGIYQYINIKIMDNEISNCTVGIIPGFTQGGSEIKGNTITECRTGVISYDEQNISGNKIRRCIVGISLQGTYSIVYGNDIDGCPLGICRYGSEFNFEGNNTIVKNNFKNYSWNEPWWKRHFTFFISGGSIIDAKDTWMDNYWDTWKGVGPMRIRGELVIGIGRSPVGNVMTFPIPWFAFDRSPAQEPYNIPGMNH